MTTLEAELKAKRQLVEVRRELLDQAERELMESIEKMMQESKNRARSRPLKVKEMCELLEKSEATLWRWEVNKLDTYYQLWQWVQENKPALLKTLETNFEKKLERERANRNQ